MKLIKTASGNQIKLSKSEWESIGKTAGWISTVGMYDENFGDGYQRMIDDGEDPYEVQKFYEDTQRNSVEKECKGCGKTVKIKHDYAYCNNCADAMERGMPVGEW